MERYDDVVVRWCVIDVMSNVETRCSHFKGLVTKIKYWYTCVSYQNIDIKSK